jgi:hypothetical protein
LSDRNRRKWFSKYPNLQNLLDFQFVDKLPRTVSTIIVEVMDMEGRNNWRDFASKCWPLFTTNDCKTKLKEKMEDILQLWGSEGAKIIDLLDILEDLQREDVLLKLNEFSK